MQLKHLLPTPDKRFIAEPCPGCPMPRGRKIGARGTPDSPMVIVLEAPGTEELKYGAPICGPSGELLDKCVPEDFDFDQAYVINAMQCRPPKTNDPVKDKDYKTRACAACRNRVLAQVFSHPRKAILALGNWSNTALTADYGFKITTRRGTVYWITNPDTGQKIPVIPAVHPAFLLRGGGNVQVFREDCATAVKMAFNDTKQRGHDWLDPEWALLEAPEHVNWLREVYEQEAYRIGRAIEVASDIETEGFGWNIGHEILSIGFYRGAQEDTAYIAPRTAFGDPEYRKALKRLLASPYIRFVWQFGKFDDKFLLRDDWTEHSMLDEDTGLLSYALSEATKDHDLDEQAKNTLGAPDHKGMLKPYLPKKDSLYSEIPPPVLHDYQAKDLKKTDLLYHVKRQLVREDPHLEKLYTRTLLPSSKLLLEVEMYGIAVDFDYVRINRSGGTPEDLSRGLVKNLEEEVGLVAQMEAVKDEIGELAGFSVNPNSPDEVANLLYDVYGLRIKGKRPEDTRKETLDKLPAHPAVKLIRKYRSINKMLSTYVTAIEKLHVNGRIHTTYKQHIAPTGRLSSSEPNIQNIPRDYIYRRMYRAGPGMLLMEGDYNTAELRMLAALSGDKFLTGVFLDDTRNLHDEVSIAMYGANFTQDQRIRAKAINFGIPYGREAYSIAEEFGITVQEAQRLIDAWFARAPEATKFIKNSRRAASRGQTLITIFGRKRRPGVVSPERIHGLMNEFSNFHMQSPISDFTLHAAIKINPRLKKEGAHIVNLIHDSVLAEYPDDSKEREQQVGGIIKECMEGVPKEWIITPIEFKVDLKKGTHWGLLDKYKLAA